MLASFPGSCVGAERKKKDLSTHAQFPQDFRNFHKICSVTLSRGYRELGYGGLCCVVMFCAPILVGMVSHGTSLLKVLTALKTLAIHGRLAQQRTNVNTRALHAQTRWQSCV